MESEYFPSYLVVLILSGLENETKIVFLGYIEIGGWIKLMHKSLTMLCNGCG